MFLARRRGNQGIYQAAGFTNRCTRIPGVKIGGFFVEEQFVYELLKVVHGPLSNCSRCVFRGTLSMKPCSSTSATSSSSSSSFSNIDIDDIVKNGDLIDSKDERKMMSVTYVHSPQSAYSTVVDRPSLSVYTNTPCPLLANTDSMHTQQMENIAQPSSTGSQSVAVVVVDIVGIVAHMLTVVELVQS